MGSRGKKLDGIDVEKLIEKLNKALADEWLAYYQYWVGSKVIMGPMRTDAETELMEHANDELRHADMLADRIVTLGGTPLLTPQQWYEKTNCGYEAPEDEWIEAILNQNIEGERCAIDVYRDLMNFVGQKDPVTYEMSREILQDEIEHEEDLENILNDIRTIKERFSR